MFSMHPRSPSTTASAPTGVDVPALVVGEPRRNLAELDRKRAAETAARLALGHLIELQPADLGEQRARLRLDVHFAQSGAAVVIGDPCLRSGPERFRAWLHSTQEVRQLARFGGERRDARLHRGIVGEELGIVRADHSRARARRRDQEIAVLELVDDLPGERPGIGAVARVVGGLAAAGLRRRYDNLGAGGFDAAAAPRTRSTGASGRRGR